MFQGFKVLQSDFDEVSEFDKAVLQLEEILYEVEFVQIPRLQSKINENKSKTRLEYYKVARSKRNDASYCRRALFFARKAKRIEELLYKKEQNVNNLEVMLLGILQACSNNNLLQIMKTSTPILKAEIKKLDKYEDVIEELKSTLVDHQEINSVLSADLTVTGDEEDEEELERELKELTLVEELKHKTQAENSISSSSSSRVIVISSSEEEEEAEMTRESEILI
jgi:hypothetical protein